MLVALEFKTNVSSGRFGEHSGAAVVDGLLDVFGSTAFGECAAGFFRSKDSPDLALNRIVDLGFGLLFVP